MQLDPDVEALLAARDAAGLPSLQEMGVDGTRQMMESRVRQPGPEMAAVDDAVLDGPFGDLEVRVYTRRHRTPAPLLVYFHGGGMIMGSVESYDPFARHLAVATDATVISVDYRLAPEYRYPTGTEEAFFATKWVVDHAADFGGDPHLVGVAGDSAGGGLAAGVCLAARDGGGPPLVVQLLMYPGVDRDFTTPSMTTYEFGPFLTKADVIWMKDAYLGTHDEPDHPYAVAANATDLGGLPPAIVVTAEHDPIRDGAEHYGARLRDAGVPTALLRYPGVCHGFMSQIDDVARARVAFAEAGALVQAKFNARTAARPTRSGEVITGGRA